MPLPACVSQGVNPWIEVDGGVTPENAYKVRGRAWLTLIGMVAAATHAG